MKFLLITVILQNGLTDIFFEEHSSLKKCKEAKEQALLHDNEVTKVKAYCVKQN